MTLRLNLRKHAVEILSVSGMLDMHPCMREETLETSMEAADLTLAIAEFAGYIPPHIQKVESSL